MDTKMLLTTLVVHLAALLSTVEPSGLTDIWSEETTGHWGEWGAKDICPDKKPVFGYRMKSEKHQGGSDDTGLNGVQLNCQGGSVVTSTVSKWGDWLAASWCPGVDNPVVGFRIMIEPKRGMIRDDTAANRVELVCQRGEILNGEAYTKWGKWSSWHKCPPGEVVVGIQTRVEKCRGWHRDDSAMNGMRVLCHEQPDVNECAKANGGCSHTCINTDGGYHCQCPDGFTLGKDERTCNDVNECAKGNGGCSHTCINTDGGYLCHCPDGFTLGKDEKKCADVNECDGGNGGCSHTCVNTDGGYHCQCPNGLTLGNDETTCADVNECDKGNGGCSHTCVNSEGGYLCQCPNGFILGKDEKKCADVNECAGGNGGCSHTCVNTEGGYLCQCPNGISLAKDEKTCNDFPYRNYKDKQCKERTWKREGCYNTKEHLVRGPLLVYWRFDIEWKKDRIHKFAHSLVCACAKAAKANGFKYFGTHFWGECWGLEMNQMVYTTRGDCKLTDGLYQTTCNENHFQNSVYECLGIKSYSVYSLRK